MISGKTRLLAFSYQLLARMEAGFNLKGVCLTLGGHSTGLGIPGDQWGLLGIKPGEGGYEIRRSGDPVIR